MADLPTAVQELRQERERLFCWNYMLNGGNGAGAARKAGYSDVKEGAKVRAHGLLQREDIQAALRALCDRYLFSLAPAALFKLKEALDSRDERVKLKAIGMVLARTGFAERTSLDVNVSGTVKVDHTTQALDDLKKMIELGVPRERLLETFGYSGLSRYEKMLADRAKVIEHDAAAPSERDL